MNKFSIRALLFSALATLALVSCSEDSAKGNDPTIPTGEKTYAVFDFKIGDPGDRATGAEVTATADEGIVKNIALAICQGGMVVEVKDLPAPSAGSSVFPDTPVLITSGATLLYAYINVNDELMAALTACNGKSVEELEKTALSLGTPGRISIPQTTGETVVTSTLDMTKIGVTQSATGDAGDAVVASKGLLMAGVKFATLVTGVTPDQAKQPGNSNHVVIEVNRNMAKVTAAIKDAAALSIAATPTSEAATLSNVTYSIRNIASTFNLLWNNDPTVRYLHPAFNAISQADYRKWYQNSAAIEYTMPTGPITVTAGVTNTPIHYTTENLFKGGYKGNVSYLHITANYTPANFITGINASTATDPAAYTTTAGTANATFFAVIVNGKPTDQLKVAADAFDTDNDAIKAAALWQITRRPVAKGQVLDVANIAMDNKTTQGWHIVYTSATNKTDKSNPVWYDEVEVKYYFDDSATVTDSFKFYIVKYTDGKCYYRMNIKNLAAGKVALDYYVNRNKFYMITANKFTGLGFAKPGDSTIVPTDPITQDTYVQGEITIMPWTEVSYGEDVGI